MRILVAMSGGVDSSVAALLLKQQGHECIGCTMRLYNSSNENSPESTCCSLADVEDARSVAYKLGMPFYVFNFTNGFKEKVIDKFIHCYQSGHTPNPCIDCNRYMKFDKLYERAKILGCDAIATGHYARIENRDGVFELKKARDNTKDQSYVLYSLSNEQLSHTLFPLGDLPKKLVRKIAEGNGLVTAHKPDSQDICFVPDGDYAKVIELYSGCNSEPGDFVDEYGNYLGKHKRIIHYTIGQRKGLGISSASPLFVKEIDSKTNRIILTLSHKLYSNMVVVKDVCWTLDTPPAKPFFCNIKIRYRQAEQPAMVIPYKTDTVQIVFDFPQRAVTPGQAAVFYQEDTVLGGGVIEKSESS